LIYNFQFFSFLWRFDPIPDHGLPFAITLVEYITLGRTPLDERSALTWKHLPGKKHITHKRQISMLLWDSNPQSQQASCSIRTL